MKKIILSIIVACCFISCSDDSDDNQPMPIASTPLKLKADKKVIEPFEKLKVSVDLDLDLINQTYDSISWIANGVFWDGLIVLGGTQDKDERDSYFVDYDLGDHQIIILGYKDRVLLSSDTINYTVKAPTGDFMNIRWGVEEGPTSYIYMGDYTPIKVTENNGIYTRRWIRFDLFRNYTSSYPTQEYATLDFLPTTYETNIPFRSFKNNTDNLPNVNDFDWHDESDEGYKARAEFEYAFLYNYLIDLYGTPTFDYKGTVPSESDLLEEYRKRVSEEVAKFGYENPVAIWDTSTSYIVLTRAENIISGEGKRGGICKVIAVPRK